RCMVSCAFHDRLFFILVYRKTSALQIVQGRLFGMGRSTAHQWMHVLLPMLLAALRALGDAPTRSLTALAQRLGVSEADVATVVIPLEEEPAPVDATPLDIITNCFLCYHQFFAQSVSRQVPSMGGYELQKQFFAQSPRERVLLSFAVPPANGHTIAALQGGRGSSSGEPQDKV